MLPQPITNNQHLREIQSHRQVWERKPILRRAYAALYASVREHLSSAEGMTVELGSGIGAIKKFIPGCITTDIFPNPWLDRVENAYGLSFADNSVSNLILFDVFHHLEWPGTAFEEFSRVMRPGGHVILMEPGFGLLGRFVYGNFHHESLGFGQPITWHRRLASGDAADHYYAAQANAWRIFVQGEGGEHVSGWRKVLVKKLPALSYIASGGFTHPALYPSAFFPWLRIADDVTALIPSLFATRLLVVLQHSLSSKDNQDVNDRLANRAG